MRISDCVPSNPKSEFPNPKWVMAARVQGLERQIVVLDVVGSIPTSRPISIFSAGLPTLSDAAAGWRNMAPLDSARPAV